MNGNYSPEKVEVTHKPYKAEFGNNVNIDTNGKTPNEHGEGTSEEVSN